MRKKIITRGEPKMALSPEKIKRLGALAHKTRLNLLGYLEENEKASFDKFKKEFNLDPNTLQYHLKKLIKANLIKQDKSDKYILTKTGTKPF